MTSRRLQLLVPIFAALITGTSLAQPLKPHDKLNLDDIDGQLLAFTPDSKLLVVASNPGIEIWNVATGKHDEVVIDIGVETMALQPDGRRGVAANGSTSEVKWFDLASHRVRKTWEAPVEGIRQVAFSPDGKLLALDLRSNQVALCESPGGKVVRTIEYASSSAAISGIAFSPDGKFIATGGSDKSRVRLWDVASGKLAKEFMTKGQYLNCARFSRDGKWLLTGHGDFKAHLWDSASGELKTTFAATESGISASHFVADISPDGRFVATIGYHGPAKLWDASSGKEVAQLPDKPSKAESLCVAFSPDGKLLAVGFKRPFGPSRQPTVMLWEVPAGNSK
jgi:WD40 repeat protein